MRCQRCGKAISEVWEFCPFCGQRIRRGKSLFDGIFERMNRQMREIDKEIGSSGQGMDIERRMKGMRESPLGKRNAKSGGFTINIRSATGQEPKVSIHTFGDFGKGGRDGPGKKVVFRPAAGAGKEGYSADRIKMDKAEVTEEPETSTRKVNGKTVAEISLPGVKNESDIEVNSLENSIEIKALAGNKAYFKIITKPADARISGRDFRDGVLRLQIS